MGYKFRLLEHCLEVFQGRWKLEKKFLLKKLEKLIVIGIGYAFPDTNSCGFENVKVPENGKNRLLRGKKC